MFDIGGPEFVVIAIVALVVLGPERLPEVMRRAGVFYRQARQLLNEYTGEAQRMFEEGLREVNDVSNTISSSWQEATGDTPVNTPPPTLFQVPPPLQAPETAANAGPWALAAWYRDARADLEPQPAAGPQTPFALAAAHPESDEVFDGFGIGGPSLMGPAPDEPAADDDRSPDREHGGQEVLPIPDGGRLAALAAIAPEAVAMRPAAGWPEPALGVADEGRLFTDEQRAAAPGNGKLRATKERKDEDIVRQETLIELYRNGDVTLEKAAEFLGISPAQFRSLLKRK